MLSLFAEEAAALSSDQGLKVARELLASSLNKGQIPVWENFLLELPEIDSINKIHDFFLMLTEWDFLKDVLETKGTEYFFHSPENSQVLKLGGKKEPIKLPMKNEDWQLWLEIISIKFRQNWNVENPFASFYGELFGKKFRIGLIHGSTSPLGVAKLVLRSLASTPHPLESFDEAETLLSLVKEKRNILIAGSTGSGKTSLLASMLQSIEGSEHLVILEDTFEISSDHPYQTRFLAGSSPQTSLKAYLSYSLRLSPDRLILGEMRSHEVIPFLMAMNTGHKGLMGTIHASSAADALHRVALLFALYSEDLDFDKVMELLCRNLEHVVFMEDKKVKEVIKVLGSEKGVPFFELVTHSFAESGEAMRNELNLF